MGSRPCIIVDIYGNILTWYLPGILEDSRQVGLFALSDHGRVSNPPISGCNSGGVRKAAPIAETIKRQEGLVQ